MGKGYIISIGGTGARVLKSLFHLCVAGCFDGNRFKVMCVDSDNSNGDKALLEETQLAYRKLGRFRAFPEISITFWSPLDTRTKQMSEMIDKAHMSEQAKDVLDFFYTEKEQCQKLEGGFYGRTSIGAYFMSQSILSNGKYTSAWKDFFDDIDCDCDKVFIIGSIFGGTGASGIPTISKIIKSIPDTSRASIGVMFVMPYFRPVGQTAEGITIDDIDWRLFNTKVRSAMAFYKDQNFGDIFQTMYFAGEKKDWFMAVNNENSGAGQRNKANHVELMAASALADFMVTPNDNPFTAKLYDDRMSNTKRLNTINGCSHLFDKLASFLKFSILHVKYFHPGICNIKLIAEGWAGKKRYGAIDKADSQLFYDYCLLFIGWLYEIGVASDPKSGDFAQTSDHGSADKNYGASNAKLFSLSGRHEHLYFDSEVSHDIGGLFKKKTHMLSELDGLRDLVAGDSPLDTGIKTGEEIIRHISCEDIKTDTSVELMIEFMTRIQNLCYNEREGKS